MVTKEQQLRANRVARAAGHHRATEVVLGEADRVLEHVRQGYRKNTTGERVSNAYRHNFGWKNTHYEPVRTVVEINIYDC